MIVLTIVTGGIYIPYWFQKTNEALSGKKISKNWLVVLWILSLISGLRFLSFILVVIFAPLNATLGFLFFQMSSLTMSIPFLRLITPILVIIFAFKLQKSLEPNFKKVEGKETFSDLLTLFFTIFYLQYKINNKR